jgi:hypothetical protein
VAILPAKITRDRNGQIVGLGIPDKNDEQTISMAGEQPFGSSTVRNDCASLRVAPSRKSATSTFSSPDEILKQCWKPQGKSVAGASGALATLHRPLIFWPSSSQT